MDELGSVRRNEYDHNRWRPRSNTAMGEDQGRAVQAGGAPGAMGSGYCGIVLLLSSIVTALPDDGGVESW